MFYGAVLMNRNLNFSTKTSLHSEYFYTVQKNGANFDELYNQKNNLTPKKEGCAEFFLKDQKADEKAYINNYLKYLSEENKYFENMETKSLLQEEY